jgi:hypothetical protein
MFLIPFILVVVKQVVVRSGEWKMFQPPTICKGGFGTKIMFFTYGFTSLLLPHPSRGRHTSLPPTLSRPSSVQKNALRRLKFRFAGTGNRNQKLNLSSFRQPLTARPRKSSKSTFVPGTNFLYKTKPRLVHFLYRQFGCFFF